MRTKIKPKTITRYRIKNKPWLKFCTVCGYATDILWECSKCGAIVCLRDYNKKLALCSTCCTTKVLNEYSEDELKNGVIE